VLSGITDAAQRILTADFAEDGQPTRRIASSG
jgi:hypothetical protein